MKQLSFFEQLCHDYYEKILHYLFATLREESTARDCTQDVFLVALEKQALLEQHPNPGGFLFQTAKNLSRKYRREGFQKMLREQSQDIPEVTPLCDNTNNIEQVLDAQINEDEFINLILAELSPEQQKLYASYYLANIPMAEIAQQMGIEEPALRMRYVRLRRQIKSLISKLSEKEFSV